MHLHQFLDDGEPQAGAALRSGRRGVDLRESLEDLLLVLLGDPDAGVVDPDLHHLARGPRLDAHAAVLVRVLDAVGDEIERLSTIESVTHKAGRTGDLIFVLVNHKISNQNGLAIIEEHDIVYRDAPGPDDKPVAPTAAPSDAKWSKTITPDDVLLFRYSALTFNGHRIHYDRKYVTEVEGYPGLIVHGPLIATLLVDLVRQSIPGCKLKSFEFRAIRPTFDINIFKVSAKPDLEKDPSGKTIAIWAQDHEGWLTMQATAVLA